MATIKDLIGKGPDELEKMTDEELRVWCEPYLRVAESKVKLSSQQPNEQGEIDLGGGDDTPVRQRAPRKTTSKEDMVKEMMKLAQLHGVDMSNFKTPIK